MQLGVILAPYGANSPYGWGTEIAQAVGGKGTYLPQAGNGYPRVDRAHNTRGAPGYYYDTQLGAIPTDAELATGRCYTPVSSGWINSKQGYVPGPWRFGWDPAGSYGPQTSLSGLRDATADDVLAAMNAHNQRVFMLSVVSTVAVSISALFALYRNARLLKRELAPKKRK